VLSSLRKPDTEAVGQRTRCDRQLGNVAGRQSVRALRPKKLRGPSRGTGASVAGGQLTDMKKHSVKGVGRVLSRTAGLCSSLFDGWLWRCRHVRVGNAGFRRSDPAHRQANSANRSRGGGVIPYDIFNCPRAATICLRAMQRWMDTREKSNSFRARRKWNTSISRQNQRGNNQPGRFQERRAPNHITAFWWRQVEWMPAHELGTSRFFSRARALGRDQFVTSLRNIKSVAPLITIGSKTNWIVSSLPTITAHHALPRLLGFRREDQCQDGVGAALAR